MPPSYSRDSILVRLISPNFDYSNLKAGLESGLVRILAIIFLIEIYLKLIFLILI